MTFVKSVDFPTSLSENLDGSISLFLLWIMWQIIGFELSRLWEYCESVEVRGRRLKNTSFRFSCQLNFSKHSFSWITSNHKPSKWTPFGYNSGGLEVVVLLSVFALWQSLLSCPFSLGGIPQTPSDHILYEKQLNGNLEHSVLSYAIQHSCQSEINLSLALLPSSAPWTELMSAVALWWSNEGTCYEVSCWYPHSSSAEEFLMHWSFTSLLICHSLLSNSQIWNVGKSTCKMNTNSILNWENRNFQNR